MVQHRRVRTTLYDDQRLLPGELDLLHTPTLQRLYDLRQLGFTDRVFVDASHLRIHHTIGTLEQVDRLVHAIAKNLRLGPHYNLTWGPGDSKHSMSTHDFARQVEKRSPVVRLMALLHDITHAPYGHTLEDEIKLIQPGHDHPQRQSKAFLRLLFEYVGWTARDGGVGLEASLATYLDEPMASVPSPDDVMGLVQELLSAEKPKPAGWLLTRREMGELLAQTGMAMTALLHLKYFEVQRPAETRYPFQTALETWLHAVGYADLVTTYKFDIYRDAWMLDVVGNTVCADLLDYAKRDARNAGIKLDFDDRRIAENFTIVSWSRFEGEREEVAYLRAAVSVFSHKLRTDVPGELMNLLNVRFYLYERAVYHSTKCAADAMLGTALQLMGLTGNAGDGSGGGELHELLGRLGDATFLHVIEGAARLALSPANNSCLSDSVEGKIALRMRQGCSKIEGDSQAGIRAGLGLLARLRARRYYRPIFRTLPNYDDGEAQITADGLARKFATAHLRFELERLIENECKLPLGSVVIHCPERATARKVADALVVNRTPTGTVSRVVRLQEVGDLDPKGVFAKHADAIRAVEEMYRSMWRLVVYVAPDQLHRAGEIAEKTGEILWDKSVTDAARANVPPEKQRVTNDPMLELELRCRAGARGDEEAPSPPDVGEERPLRLLLAVHPLMNPREFQALLKELASGDGQGMCTAVSQLTGDEFTSMLSMLEKMKEEKNENRKRKPVRSGKAHGTAPGEAVLEYRDGLTLRELSELIDRVRKSDKQGVLSFG